MTAVQTIIQQAYREGNLIPVGTDPTAAELAEGLGRLNPLMKACFGTGLGEQLADWLSPQPQRTAPVAANFPQGQLADDLDSTQTPYPPKNSRILWNGTTQTIYFPEAPCDGSRMGLVQVSGLWNGDPDTPQNTLILAGNGRMIEAAATVVYANTGVAAEWFYRADLGAWVQFSAVAATDEMQFPTDLDDLWILLLAMRLAGRYGKALSKETIAALKAAQAGGRQMYTQHQDTVFGARQIPNTWQSYSLGRLGGSGQ